MKLVFMFVLIGTLHLSAGVYSQTKKLNLDLKNVSLKQVLEELEKQTDVTFLYSDSNLDINKAVTIVAHDQTLEQILDRLFSDNSVNYSMIENHIIISVKESPLTAQQQTFTVTGKVTDDKGEPLAGVNVYEKSNPQHGVITSADGTYSITVANKDATLVYSFIGFENQELHVAGRSVINVTLVETITGLNEVVVTALSIPKEAKTLGYAVAKVDNERILASGTPLNAIQSLYGSAAGVNVSSTASGPTGGMKINIRNAVSFDSHSTTRPLIVVDGIPIHDENTSIGYGATSRDNGTGINDINPDDIASFEILKGAKASVLYGSEGANGVILITTKSGKKSKDLGVSASVTTSWDKMAFLPELQDQYGTGRSPSTVETDAQGFYLDENNERTLDYSGSAFGPKFDPNVMLNWWDGSKRPWVARDESVYDKLYRQGHQTTTNVAVSNGNDKGSIRFSYTNMQFTPITPGGKFDKNSFSLSAKYDLNEHISLSYSGNYYFTTNLNAINANSMDAQGARASLGAYSADIDVDLLREYMVTEDGYNYFASPENRRLVSNGRMSIVGFLWDQTQNEAIYNRNHNIQSLTLNIKLNKALSINMLGGVDATVARDQYKGKLQDPSLIGPNSGSMYMDNTKINRKSYGQGMFNFNFDVSDFNFSGFVGGVMRHNYYENKGASVKGGMVIPNWFSFNNLPSGQQPVYQKGNGEDMLYSLLGSFQLSWKDMVYVELQGRQDWSSILPPDHNSYFYPGVSATWLLNETLSLPIWVQFAKLRVSGADVGRPGPRYFSNVNYGVSQSGSGYILIPPSDLPPMDENGVPNLEPERKREYEVGAEAYFFNGSRIGFDFSYYTAHTYNQIMKVAAPPGMGVNSIRMNAGDVASYGWELALKTKPILNNNFHWDLNFMFSQGKTRVEKLDGELKSLSLWGTNGLNAVAEVGGEYGLIYQQKGWQDYINPSDDNDPNNGKRIVKGDGTMYNYSSKSTKMVGKILPDVTGGIFSSFGYKNLRFIFNIDYSFGAFFISETETYMMAAGVLNNTLKYRDKEHGGLAYHMDAGQKVAGEAPAGGDTYYDGVILDGVYPDGTPNDQVVSAEDYYYASYFSNGFFPEDRLFKSDYVALRNMALDYSFPHSMINKIKLTDLTLSVFVNNVAYLYKAAPNSIPEAVNGTGWGSSSYGTTALPAQRSVGVSLKVNF